MKKLLLTIGLVAAVSMAYGQGTVAFSNGGLNKISTGLEGSASATWVVVPTTPGLYNFGLFYGIGESTSLTLLSSQLGVNSTSAAGVIANSSDSKSALGAVAIPTSLVGETDVWIQIKGWSASYGTDWAAAQAGAAIGNGYFGTTGNPINVGPLGPTAGPGIPFWTTAAGTSTALHPGGIALFQGTIVPEPATMTLAGLGIASLLIFRRRK